MSQGKTKTLALTAAAVLIAGVVGGGASAAHAGFTPYAGTKHNEAGLAKVFELAYGGDFVADGHNFTNGLLTAVRIDDDHDRTFTGKILGGRMLARYAAASQELGYLDAGGNYTSLGQVDGWGFPVTGAIAAADLSGGTYTFARAGSGMRWSSDPADNGGGDQLITFKLVPAGVQTVAAVADTHLYVQFWEDLDVTKRFSDRDYNDMVLELAVQHPVAIPLPAAALIGGATLLGLAAARRWRRVI